MALCGTAAIALALMIVSVRLLRATGGAEGFCVDGGKGKRRMRGGGEWEGASSTWYTVKVTCHSTLAGWGATPPWCSSDLAAVARTRATGKNEGETRGWETVMPASTVPHTPTRVP